MRWDIIRSYGYRFHFTRNEQNVLLFLSVMLLSGMVLLALRSQPGGGNAHARKYDYGNLDREMSAAAGNILGEGDSSSHTGSPDAKRTSTSQPPPSPVKSAPATPVDLNRATRGELEQLPGIGPSTAEKIVIHRTTQGPFRSIEELRRVRGIGEKKMARLRPYVTVGH